MDGKLALHDASRDYWLAEFGGSEKRLELALRQAAGWIQPDSRRPLASQVGCQLAKQLADKLDKDERYAAVVKAKQSPGRRSTSRFGAGS